MAENKQLKNVIFWLQSQGYISSQKDLAEKLGYNVAFMSQMVSGNKPISSIFIEKLVLFSKGRINENYLSGIDDVMLVEDVDTGNIESPAQAISPDKEKYITALESLLSYKDKEIADLTALVNKLQREVAELQRTAR